MQIGMTPPPMSILDKSLKHLMMRLQPWRYEECEIFFHCHYFQVNFDPEW